MAAGGDVGLLDVDIGIRELPAGGSECTGLVRQRFHDHPPGGSHLDASLLQGLQGILGTVHQEVDDALALARERTDRLDVDACGTERLTDPCHDPRLIIRDDHQILAHRTLLVVMACPTGG